MIGKPKYNYEEEVKFEIIENGITKIKTGKIAIIDEYGTFFDNSDVSYDVMVIEEEGRCLYKHINEKFIMKD